MKIARMLSVVLLAGISVAMWTAQGSAAVRNAPGSRDATTERCIVEARKHYPGKYYDWGEIRDFQYQNCMHDAGFPP
jgi:hypothetical protein